MSRTILGQKLSTFTVSTLGVVAASTAPSGKLDPHPMFVRAHGDAGQPASFDFMVPRYDSTTHNKLIGVTVVVLPIGHGEPATVDDWLNCSYPKATLDTSSIGAPSVTAPATVPAPIVDPSVAAVGVPIGTPAAVVPAAVPAPTAAPVAVAVPVAAPVAATPVTAAAPTSAGTPISVPVPNVPVGDHSAQVLLTYDA